AEGGERAVATTIGREAADATARAVPLEPSSRRALVEHLADLRTMRHKLGARGSDVGDDQIQALGRTGSGRRQAAAELNRAPRARRGELDEPNLIVGGQVGVAP